MLNREYIKSFFFWIGILIGLGGIAIVAGVDQLIAIFATWLSISSVVLVLRGVGNLIRRWIFRHDKNL
ncbi:MAG: hypothetical protein H3Z50_03425 [archaeon]|nr:hypothetical protein [archaeon]MCP8306618.1 hypothetical protein [archaeon]